MIGLIGQNIYKIRKERGLTLSDVAEKANLSKSYLSSIERNLNQNPSIKVIEKIARVFEVDPKILISPKQDFQQPEKEWLEFVNELKESGIEKDQLKEYKAIIEFAKWQKTKVEEDLND